MTPFTKWETVANLFNPADRPVVLNRASSTNTTNPFGSTFCYGYQDIIFEVIMLLINIKGFFPRIVWLLKKVPWVNRGTPTRIMIAMMINLLVDQVMPNGHIASLTLYLPTGLSPVRDDSALVSLWQHHQHHQHPQHQHAWRVLEQCWWGEGTVDTSSERYCWQVPWKLLFQIKTWSECSICWF